ncbi:MAG TPA: hypothetical protein VFV34_06340, partial [Blastocatellia bacterium]|nr:hypothetical protein [Blastocatellia bacterium]
MRALSALRANKRQPGDDDHRTASDPDLESLVLQKAAATDPALVLDWAIKCLNGSLTPGVVDTYIALRGVSPEMGRQLGRAIVARLPDEVPDPASPAAQAAFALMVDIASRAHAAAPNSQPLDLNSIRHLATFVADLLLARQSLMSGAFTGDPGMFSEVLEEYAPSKAGQIRRRFAKLTPQPPFGAPDMKELDTFLQEKNYDRAADWAKRAPVDVRRDATYRVAEAQIEDGQFSLARTFVSSQIKDSESRDELLGRVTLAEAKSAAGKGDEETTRGLMRLLPPGNGRLMALLSLAQKSAKNGDREKSIAIIEEALALPADKAGQLRNELVVADACLEIDKATAIEIVSAHIERVNTLLGAAAVLDGYLGPECVHDGEIRYFSPLPLFPAVVTLCDVLSRIAMVDSDQALRLARSIAAPELQTLATLTIAQRLILGPDYRPDSIEPTSVQALARSSG